MTELVGRLVLRDEVVAGRIVVEGQHIAAVEPDARGEAGPLFCPGFVDVHVHGWGGHDAMGDEAALDGMARALLRHGVTAFLPTAAAAPIDELAMFADRVRRWMPTVDGDRATPLGYNSEGPCISHAKKGAQNPANIVAPTDLAPDTFASMLDGLRIMTVAPEEPGGIELVQWLSDVGVSVALGHSNATADQSAAGYAAGARSTTHLFNAMSGVDNHAPGLASAALATDGAYVELVADGLHVDQWLWQMILRAKPQGRVILVSDAISLAGTGDQRTTVGGGIEVEIRGESCRLVSDGRLAGSVIALDSAIRNLVKTGVPLPVAVAAASRNALDLLGVVDRGELVAGQLADVVELDDTLHVERVMRAGQWYPGPKPVAQA
jgi:N-acetylglucosamine-6-phosphate deacetylase